MIENMDWLAAWLMGFLGSAHCVGMCGGMAASFRLAIPDQKAALYSIVFYNAGRISSYVLLGLLLGFLGGHYYESLTVGGIETIRVFAACLLISMGLYLLKLPNLLPFLERLGSLVWRRIQPLTRHLLPVKNRRRAWVLGLLWGFLPCGLVYSAWTLSATQTGIWQGGAIMLAFGLGTLPSMLAVGIAGEQIMKARKRRVFQIVSALILIAYGVFVLYQLLAGEHQHEGQEHHHQNHHH